MKKLITFIIAAVTALVLLPSIVFAAVTFPVNGGTGSTTLSGILIGNGTSPVNTLTIGTNLTLTGTTLNATGGGSSTFGTTSLSAVAPLHYSQSPLAQFSITQSGVATDGYLSSTDWNTFNNKQYAFSTSTLSASSPLTGSFIQIGSGGSLGCQTASGSQAGCLSSADWNIFNNKLSTDPNWQVTGGVLVPTTTIRLLVGQANTPTNSTFNDIADFATTSLNDFASVGVWNTSAGNCATAEYDANNNASTLSTNYASFGITGGNFTGVGCTNNPFPAFGANSLYEITTNGNQNFAIGSTSSSAQFRWLSDTNGDGAYTSADTKMILTQGGDLGIGSTTPDSPITISNNLTSYATPQNGTELHIAGSGINSRITVDTYNGGVTGAIFQGRTAGGTNLAPTFPGIDQTLGGFSGDGYGTSGFHNISLGGFYVKTESTPFTNSSAATYLALFDSATTTVSSLERMRITSKGAVAIGTTSPLGMLSVQVAPYASTTGNYVFALASSTAAATTTLFSVKNTGVITTNYGTGCVLSTAGVLSVTGSGCNAGTVTSVTGTYPVQSTGGTTPVISLAFGTTTSNLWANTQTFTNSPVFSSLGAGTVNSTAAGTIYNTSTSTPTVTSPITYSGTLGQFIGGASGAFACATCLTANQTITLTGAVTGSGSTAITTAFGSAAANTVLANATGASAVPSFVATSSLFTGTAGQAAYFSGTGALVGTSTLFISTAGKVGIGTTSPQDTFVVAAKTLSRFTFDFTDTTNGAAQVALTENSSLKGLFDYVGSTFSNPSIANTIRFGSFSSTPLTIYTNGSERMRIDASGNVGIGTTTPHYPLEVQQVGAVNGLNIAPVSATNQRALIALGMNAGFTKGWAFGASTGQNTTSDFFVYDGLLATFPFQINTNDSINILTPPAAGVGATYLCLSTGLTINSGATCAASTKKVKTNIAPVTGDLAKILALVPVTFKYKPGYYDGALAEGFIAEDVAKVDPRFAEYASKKQILADGEVVDKGDPQALDTTAILSATVGAVQELNAKVEVLTKQVSDLQAQIKTLKK